MARPREFDTDEVLGIALELFWGKGFKACSYVDLEEKTGVKKASLVAAYGDKHSLFIAAVEKYLGYGKVMTQDAFSGKASPKKQLANWLAQVVGGVSNRGCLAVNTIIEQTASDPVAAKMLKKYLQATEAIIAKAISAGVDAGDFRKCVQPEVAARFLITFACGVSVVGKSGLGNKNPDVVVEMVLSSLI